MADELQVRRVEVSLVGAAPARQVRPAAGVSEVEAEGLVLRCVFCGSFQPFLEWPVIGEASKAGLQATSLTQIMMLILVHWRPSAHGKPAAAPSPVAKPVRVGSR
jgi:hypothetical protein